MAIKLKRHGEGDEQKIDIVMDNSHIKHLDNIVERYDAIKNEAQALDFMLKAVGETNEKAETLSIDDSVYIPEGYE